jgi:nucleoside-diphosphate-sugar epimerase
VTTRVLITGASGLIGRILREALAERYALSGLDVRRVRGSGLRVADMRKLGRRVRAAFEGHEVVVDLAANPSVASSWDEVRTNNLRATLNALEAATHARVKRLVFASSNHVTGLYEREPPYSAIVAGAYEGLDPAEVARITSQHPVRPDSPYAVGKVFGEAAGRYYAEEHGLSVICLRIGTVHEGDRPRNAREFATLLTQRDLVSLVDCCIRAPETVRFAVFYGVSANTWRIWEIADARDEIGFVPADDAEAWR